MTSGTANPTLEQQNTALVKEFMEVFSTGDVDKILSYLNPTATWWVGGEIDGVSGTKNKEEFGQMLSSLSTATVHGAIKLTPKAFTAQGDRVAVETESYSEMSNGKVYNNLYHFVFIIRDGRLETIKEYLDTEHTREVFFG